MPKVRKRRLKLLILVIGAAAAGATIVGATSRNGVALDPRWIEIGVATDGTRALVHDEPVTLAHGQVGIRQRFLRPKAEFGSATRIEQDVVYDCPGQRVLTRASVEYSEDGSIIRSERLRPPAQDPIVAGSLPELIYDALC